MNVRDASNTSRAIVTVAPRDAGSVSRMLAAINVRDAANTSRSVLTGGAASYTADPQSVSGAGYSKGNIVVTTNNTTVTAPQGATYSWAFSDVGWTATGPSSSNSAFSKRCAAGNDFSVIATCTVTYNGQTNTVQVEAEVTNTYGGLE